ncbi:hypothetical protein Bca4012_018707 [Brassica carinata]
MDEDNDQRKLSAMKLDGIEEGLHGESCRIAAIPIAILWSFLSFSLYRSYLEQDHSALWCSDSHSRTSNSPSDSRGSEPSSR